MTFSKKASVFVHSCLFRTFIHWKDMKIVLKQSDFSIPAILVQRNQQLKQFQDLCLELNKDACNLSPESYFSKLRLH